MEKEDLKIVKMRIDKKNKIKLKKIEPQSWKCEYAMHEELIIFPVFSKLKKF